ncbi:MAG: DUF4238 domain-containing protein [Verrucomicrobiota bacterium]
MADPKNKKQHFVPQHYLRHFCDEKEIGIAALDPYRFIGRDKIKNHCQANYFYRHNGTDSADDWLRYVEQTSASVIREIAKRRTMSVEELVGMRMLTVIFYLRTRKAAEIAKQFPKYWADVVLKDGIDKGELREPEEGWRPGLMDFEGVSGMLFKNNLVPNFMEMETLHYKFLTPSEGSNKLFYTSDHPVILMNQLLDRRGSGRSFSGFGRSGFQLVFPLSPTSCLFFYDPQVYKVGNRKTSIVPIGSNDIDLLNSLQIQSADKCLLFEPRTHQSEVGKLMNRFQYLRLPVGAHLERQQIQGDSEELIRSFNSMTILPSPWSFCKKVKHPKVGPNYRRNESWTEYCQLVADEFDRDPSDLDGALIRAEAKYIK